MSSIDKERLKRYEWGDDNDLEVVQPGKGKEINLDEHLAKLKKAEKAAPRK